MSPKKRGGGGKISRRMALLLIGGGAVGSLGVTGAFSSVQGPRRVALGQKDDDAALLRLVSSAEASPANTPLNVGPITYSVVDGDTVALIDVTNAVGEDIDFTTLVLTSTSGSGGASLQSPPSSLSDGETATLEATITCPSADACGNSIDNVSVDLDIVAEGPTTVIDLTRTLEVSCQGACVPCNSGAEELVKYEWTGGAFEIEESADSNIWHVSTTLDSEGEPSEATFATDYCSVDAIVKAGPNEKTYEAQSCEFTVTEIDGKAISHVRFYCDDSGGSAQTDTPTPTPTDTPTPTAVQSNQAPTAAFTYRRKGNSSNVDLDASNSSDPDGSITSYDWDLGDDGSVDHTGQTVANANVPAGTSVTLTVTDDSGATDSVTKTIE